MRCWLRRLCWLTLLAGAGAAAYTVWLRRNTSAPAAEPVWPPFATTTQTPQPAADAPTAKATEASTPSAPPARWMAPVDGRCPEGYTVKVNDSSGIYHVPGGRFYERTTPDRCYAGADDALADGYRPAKA